MKRDSLHSSSERTSEIRPRFHVSSYSFANSRKRIRTQVCHHVTLFGQFIQRDLLGTYRSENVFERWCREQWKMQICSTRVGSFWDKQDTVRRNR